MHLRGRDPEHHRPLVVNARSLRSWAGTLSWVGTDSPWTAGSRVAVRAELAMASESVASSVLAGLASSRAWQEQLYRDVHEHPELSHQEQRTASLVADRLRRAGFDVHEGVGGTGV